MTRLRNDIANILDLVVFFMEVWSGDSEIHLNLAGKPHLFKASYKTRNNSLNSDNSTKATVIDEMWLLISSLLNFVIFEQIKDWLSN